MLQMKKLSVAFALCGAAALNATAHAADIKVGIALDLSGSFSVLGAEARDGFELAIEKLGGKLGGQPAEFIRSDFGGNPEQDRKSTRLNSSHYQPSRMPSSA